MYGDISETVKAFVILVMLSVMIDKFMMFLNGIMPKIPLVPDKIEWTLAYILNLATASVVCWQGHYDIFSSLGVNWKYAWEGWLLTGLVISGGSAFLKAQFKLMNLIPAPIRNMYSMFTTGDIGGNDNGSGTQSPQGPP